ncbi:MAG: hypothetical protein LBJ47_09195 [Tannerella sp.]|jgi:hypothetical protein|nr:hypothetical protein [Tannerella sp.]
MQVESNTKYACQFLFAGSPESGKSAAMMGKNSGFAIWRIAFFLKKQHYCDKNIAIIKKTAIFAIAK